MSVKLQSCWICGSPASSREHAIKQTDIRRHIGQGPYPKGNRVIRIEEDGTKKLVQAESSKLLKRSPSLCADCNNTRSQPWDRAYTIFTNWVFSHEAHIRRFRRVNFRVINSKYPGQLAKNTYKYIVKAFGCALADASAEVPEELARFLKGESDSIPLYIYFAVFNKLKIGERFRRAEIHSLQGCGKAYNWGYSLDWLTFSMTYGYQASRSLGPGWLGKSTKIWVGRF